MSLPGVTPAGGIEICGHFIPNGVSFYSLSYGFPLCQYYHVSTYAAEFRPLSEQILGLYIAILRFLGQTLHFSGPTDGSMKTLAI